MRIHVASIFKDPNVEKHLSCLHDEYVVTPTDKTLHNTVFVCKSHYIDSLVKELGIDNWQPKTYTQRQETKERVSDFCLTPTQQFFSYIMAYLHYFV